MAKTTGSDYGEAYLLILRAAELVESCGGKEGLEQSIGLLDKWEGGTGKVVATGENQE